MKAVSIQYMVVDFLMYLGFMTESQTIENKLQNINLIIKNDQ